ncbi:MAG TPA: FecR domain-containing protein [Polyangiaceae bacterium]|mgnify:CR=1 FL=1|nr:FecR domain-containing protein [Polyangiaceae bacterium]
MSSRPPSHFIKPDLSAATLERQLEHIHDRVEHRRARRFAPWALAAAAAAVALVLGVLWQNWPATNRTASSAVVELETSASGQALTLADGSRLELGANTRLDLAEASPSHTRLVLARGRVTAEVTHVPTRRFSVSVADYEVHVVGTRFTVERDVSSDDISVQVARGEVQVRLPGGKHVAVRAGQRWSKASPDVASATAASAAVVASVQPADAPELPDAANAADAKNAAESPAPSAAPGKPQAPSAKELFDRAQRARAAGKNAAAAAAFRELRTRYPDDPRAPLAAFELGRIELDAKKDPKAATKALDDALSATPKDAPYREEIEARRVESLGAAGDKKGCAAARAAFLQRYPHGIHRARVARACQ